MDQAAADKVKQQICPGCDKPDGWCECAEDCPCSRCTQDCTHELLDRHEYEGNVWWQCADGCDFLFRESQLSASEERVRELEKACMAIATALAEPAGGEYWTARKLADEWGIYNDDLDGERVLLKLAEAAIDGRSPLRPQSPRRPHDPNYSHGNGH